VRLNDVLQWFTAIGFGTGLAAVITALISARSQKGKSRAEAADLLIGAAERVGKMNHELELEIRELKSKMDTVHFSMLEYLSEDITRSELLKIMKDMR
jgi:hypothetical protein